MSTVLIDYESGNLHSAQKAFERMSASAGAGEVIVTADPKVVLAADRVVLPGDGAFPACRKGLQAITGLEEALIEVITQHGRPFMGICVGMQMMARLGHEYETVPGLNWIDGDVQRIAPKDATLKIPHMGWNDLIIEQAHPVLEGIKTGDHAYFVHSYQMHVNTPQERLASCEYGESITAIVGRDNVIGCQFHPEKSQQAGLRIIENFLTWRP